MVIKNNNINIIYKKQVTFIVYTYSLTIIEQL
jgi:hypothetical protein